MSQAISTPCIKTTGDLEPLVDRLGRIHRSLRISVTDACNIRCQYCMPEDGAEFVDSDSLLSFEQISRFVAAVLPMGLNRIRLTGGEPLLRPRLFELVDSLSQLGADDLSLTTNGMLLDRHVDDLVQAGLRRVNISLDTLSENTFKRISRRPGLNRVLNGIDAALASPDLVVKLNALVLRGVNEQNVLELVDFASVRGLQIRFIEFMPLDAERTWSDSLVVTGAELRERISSQLGPLIPVSPSDPSRPSRDFTFADSRAGGIGFIDSVSQPFCGSCDRLRLTADGKVRNCLFGQEEWEASRWLTSSADADKLREELRRCVLAKHPAHGIADPDFRPPQRAMYQIGG